jgi:small subunit ribosomal protein S6
VPKYECVFILRADLPEAEMESRVAQIGTIVSRHEGEMTHQDHWGVRKLAYEIDDETKGDYMLLRFTSAGTSVAEIEKYLRLDDKVLRHLVVIDEEWEETNRVAMNKRRSARKDSEETA